MPIPLTTNTAALPDDENRSQQRGTGFTNINKILDANTGAGEKIGQKIGSDLSDQANSVRAGIQSSQNSFNQQKQQASDQANNAIKAGTGLTQQAGENQDQYATRLANGTTDYNQIGQNLQNASYTGPTGLTNAGQVQAQGATASALGKLAGNTQGQTQLLQSMVAKPGQYTSGQSALDSLLLGQNGQQAIQKGRQATIGVGTQAQGAVDQAAAQANALKTGIDTNRANTIQSLQNSLTGAGDQTSNGVTGLQTLAQNQATSFNNDATRLQQILAGKNADGSPITTLSDTDKKLIDNMSQYGIDNTTPFYTGDQNATQSALNSLSGSLALNPGQLKYQGDQQQAAQNLASVLGQTDISNSIKNNQFNTNLFSKDPSITNAQNVAQQEAQNKYSTDLSKENQALRLGALANSGQVGGELYDLLDSLAPGARSQIDNLNASDDYKQNAFKQVAQQLANSTYGQLRDTVPQEQQNITANQQNLRNAILQRLSTKDWNT